MCWLRCCINLISISSELRNGWINGDEDFQRRNIGKNIKLCDECCALGADRIARFKMGYRVERYLDFLEIVCGAFQCQLGLRILHPRGIFLLPNDAVLHPHPGHYFRCFVNNIVSWSIWCNRKLLFENFSVNILDITKTQRGRKIRRERKAFAVCCSLSSFFHTHWGMSPWKVLIDANPLNFLYFFKVHAIAYLPS